MSLPRPTARPAAAVALRKPLFVVGLVLIAAALGYASTQGGAHGGTGPVAVAAPEVSVAPTEVASPEPSPASFDWVRVIAALDARRSAVFGHPRLSLQDVDRPGSIAFERDEQLRLYLAQHSLHADGMSFQIQSARELARRGSIAQVRVIDTRSAYVLKNARGVVVANVGYRARHSWTVSLRLDQGAWRITDIND